MTDTGMVSSGSRCVTIGPVPGSQVAFSVEGHRTELIDQFKARVRFHLCTERFRDEKLRQRVVLLMQASLR